MRLNKFATAAATETAPLLNIQWQPRPNHPQYEAYYSEADEIFFGGKAGAGKSDLLLGLALLQHEKSIIFRREYPQLKGLIERSQEIIKQRSLYNRSEKIWRLGEGRFLEFGSCQHEDDVEKYQGRPHDFIGIDELTHFSKQQYTFLIGWNRTTTEGQRCRIVATGNPPTNNEGRWVIEHFAPWLDPKYQKRTGLPPAVPGELRYFATGKDGVEREYPTLEEIELDGEILTPKSRTYIPGEMLEELIKTGYRARLQSLPEPLRSILLEGNFQTSLQEDPWQLIPTAWVEAAIARWNSLPPIPLTHLGVDVSRGGKDRTVIVRRHGTWVDKIIALEGKTVVDGFIVADQVMAAMQDNPQAIVRIDVLAVGASPYDILKQRGVSVRGLNGGAASSARDRTGQLGFKNKRAEWGWNLRELLDPSNPAAIAIPDDPNLRLDLTTVRWRVAYDGSEFPRIQLESKDELAKPSRLGRSTDYGDALGYAFAAPEVTSAFDMEF